MALRMSSRLGLIVLVLTSLSALALRLAGELQFIDERVPLSLSGGATSVLAVAPAGGSSLGRYQLRNVGRATLDIEDVFLFADDAGVFRVGLDGGFPIAPGDSVPFTIQFVPGGQVGHFAASLVVDMQGGQVNRDSLGLCATSVTEVDAGTVLSLDCTPAPVPERPRPPAPAGCTSAPVVPSMAAALLLLRRLASRRARA